MKRSVIVRLLAIIVAGYLVYTLVDLWRDLDKKQIEYNNLLKKKETTQAEIEEYKALLSEDSQKAIVEKAARERFGFAYPEDEIYKEIK